MPEPVPEARRGAAFGALAGLAIYLMVAWPAPATFFMAGFGGLLLQGGPWSPRRWLWMGVVGVWALLVLPDAAPVHQQAAKAGGVMAAAAFLLLTTWWPRLGSLDRALVATAGGVAGVVAWSAALGVPWAALRAAALQEAWTGYRSLAASVAGSEAGAALLQAAREGVPPAADSFPAQVVLLGLLGLVLADRWATRVRGEAPAGRFSALRFNDQLVWLLVAGVALVVVRPGPGSSLLGLNLLVVLGVLYLLRGAAVLATLLRPLPRVVTALLALAAVLLFPFAASGLFVVGLADTWMDIRRRLPPSLAGGANP